MTVAITSSALLSCQKSDQTESVSPGYMYVQITDALQTRALLGQESELTDVQLLVFNSTGGETEVYHKFTDDELESGGVDAFPLPVGSYDVFALANGPDLSECGSSDELSDYDIELGQYNDPESGGDFVMSALKENVSVASSTESEVNLELKHYLARVVVSSVENGLKSGKTLEVSNIFLSNVVGNQNLKADADASTWYNAQGVLDRTSSKIVGKGSNAAECEELTYKSVEEELDYGDSYDESTYLYGYPNSSTVTPAGFTSSFNGEKSVVVVTAVVSGNTYYYPIVLSGGLERHKSYDVSLTITGSGSTDPDKPVSKGSMSVTVKVVDWESGASYTEVI